MTFQVEQRVRVTESVATIFFGIGEIVALDGGKALVKWDNEKWKTQHWIELRWLEDVETEQQQHEEQEAEFRRWLRQQGGDK